MKILLQSIDELEKFVGNAFNENMNVSMMRIMCFLSLITAMALAIVGLCLNRDLYAVAILCSAFLTPAFAGKHFSKKVETQEKKVE